MKHLAVMLAVALSATAFAKPKKVKAKKPAVRVVSVPRVGSGSGAGQVTFVTATTAYLDRGTGDGLTVGATVQLTRAGKPGAKCTVAAVSDKWATCAGQGMQVGDRLAVNRAPSALPSAPEPVAGVRVLEQRRAVLEAEVLPLVDFAGRSGGLFGGNGRVASAALSHTTWFNLASSGGPFHVQRVDVGVYDVQIWKGLHASADVSVLNFAQRPANFRALPGSPILLVRQLELSFHSPQVPLIAQLGRTWTRHTPGLLVVDGAQAGWKNATDTLEVGAYGGLLPEPLTLGLSSKRWGAGAFAMARFDSGRGATASLFQVEGRLGYAERAPLSGRLELAVAGHAWVNRTLDAHLQVELGALGAMSPGLIDGVRADVGWRPTQTLRISAGGRYQGTVATDALEQGVTLPGGQRAVHADAAATYELLPWLWLSGSAGVASDFSSGLTQARVGPDLTLPGLLGGTTSLTVGYQEELGWLRGRTAWLQAAVTPIQRLRVLTRGSWFHQQLSKGDEGLAGHEIGVSLIVDFSITRWLWVRATANGRGQPTAIDANSGSRLGGTVMGQVGGQL